jgi:hypothetical protein
METTPGGNFSLQAGSPVATQLQLGSILWRVPKFHKISVATEFQLENVFHFIGVASVKGESAFVFSPNKI